MGDIEGAWPDDKVKSRFLAKVNFDGPFCEHLGTSCYLWTAFTNDKGYGRFGPGGSGLSVPAHRFIYGIAVGEVPSELQVDHMCHVRSCVRPSHLRLATNLENGQNPSGPSKNSASGLLGVHWDKERAMWRASIRVRGKLVNLGRFADSASAVAAREEAERRLFPTSIRLGDIGDNPRRVEVVPETPAVRPAPQPVAPPVREPEKVPEREPVPA